MNDSRPSSIDLQAMARQVMLAQGFEPNFPPATQQQLADISAHPPQLAPSDKVRDLRGLLWSSIDNDTSRDLDQIEVAEHLPNGNVKVMVGIADVDAFVAKDSPIDQHAARETTTVYTGICNFSMLPEDLSTGASSLLENVDRPAVVIEFVVDAHAISISMPAARSAQATCIGPSFVTRHSSLTELSERGWRARRRLRREWPRLQNFKGSSSCRTKLPRR